MSHAGGLLFHLARSRKKAIDSITSCFSLPKKKNNIFVTKMVIYGDRQIETHQTQYFEGMADKRDRLTIDISDLRERIERLQEKNPFLAEMSFGRAIRFLLRRGIEQQEREDGIVPSKSDRADE